MASRPAKTCDKFLPFRDEDKLGSGFAEICTCVWRPGLVHRSGQAATPCMCLSAHQEPATPLAGWFGTPPASAIATHQSTPAVNHSESAGSSPTQSRKSAAEINSGKPARKGRSSNKTQSRSAPRQELNPTISDRTPRSRDTTFMHRMQASEYIDEYRNKHTLRLVGRDGSPVAAADGDAGFGKNLPNPYLFKSENFRKMYRRLEECLKRRPKPASDTTLPLAIERSFDTDDVSPSETIPDAEPPAFKIPDLKVQTNMADVISPIFRKPKDLTFQPYISGSSASQAPVKYSHSASKRPGTFPNIGQDSGAAKFSMPAYVVTDSGNLRRGADGGGPTGTRVSREDTTTVVRLLEPKTFGDNGNSNLNARPCRNGNGSESTPNVLTVDFDAAMFEFLQKARQNLERVREQRARKEAISKSRLVTRGVSRSGLVVTSGKARTIRSSTAAEDVRRINLGVSQS